jgi:hypothetical protein
MSKGRGNGFIFLITNLILIFSFFIWSGTPMWYSELNYITPLDKDSLPLDYKWTDEQEKKYLRYLKKIDNANSWLGRK